MFVLRVLYKMEKIIERWIPPHRLEETFFLYDVDTQESEPLYPVMPSNNTFYTLGCKRFHPSTSVPCLV